MREHWLSPRNSERSLASRRKAADDLYATQSGKMLLDALKVLGATLPQKEHHGTWKGDAD